MAVRSTPHDPNRTADCGACPAAYIDAAQSVTTARIRAAGDEGVMTAMIGECRADLTALGRVVTRGAVRIVPL
jgi:hypothetical protein